MPSIRATDGYVAVKSMLLDLATNPDAAGQCKIQIILKLVKQPQVLAAMVSTVFDQAGEVPDIYEIVAFHNGQKFAAEYATALYSINLMRRGQGRDEMPFEFKNENGNPNNVVDFASYKRRRELAA